MNTSATPSPEAQNANETPSPVPTQTQEITDNITSAPSQSIAGDASNLQFYYDGNNYRFAVTNDGTEDIAYNNDGTITDMLRGAGYFEVNSSTGLPLAYSTGVASLEKTDDNGVPGVIVHYAIDGDAKDTSGIYTKYIFHPDYIEAIAGFDCQSDKTVSGSQTKFSRDIRKAPQSFSCAAVGKWSFPTNNDYPYKAFESLMTLHKINDYNIYTFIGRTGQENGFRYDNFPVDVVPISFGDGSNVSFSLHFAFRLEIPGSDTDNKTDAHAYCTGSDFSVSATIDGQKDNTAMVAADKATISLKVKNLTDTQKNVQLVYNLLDYYGDKTGPDTPEAHTIAPHDVYVCEIPTIPDAKTGNSVLGSYWLDYTASTDTASDHGLFTFGLIPQYTSKHNDTNPFGISGIPDLPDSKTIVSLLGKMNVSITRLNIAPVTSLTYTQQILQRAQMLHDLGIRMFGQQIYWNAPTDPTGYQKEIQSAFDSVKDYVVAYEVGNEDNMVGGVNTGANIDAFTQNIFNPGYNVVNGSEVPYMIAAFAGPDITWLNDVANTLWDKFSIISFHPYSIPQSPDSLDANPYWSIEKAIQLFMAKESKIDGGKPVWITETGYSATPKNVRDVDPRTIADYLPRTYAIAMDSGIKVVCWYSLMDVGYGQAFDDNDWQYHFGLNYTPDLNNIVMPNIGAVSYATMGRMLDGVDTCKRIYTSDSMDRFYNITKLDGSQLAMLWTDQYPMENDNGASRRVMRQPWQEHWSGTVDRTFKSDQTEVRVTDIMGNTITYPVVNGEVTLKLSGSPVYVKGVKLN